MSSFSFKSVGKTTEQQLIQQFNAIRTQFGPATPLQYANTGADVFLMHTSLADLVHDNLKNLLLTNRGERLVLTDYGANLLPLCTEFNGIEQFDEEALDRIKLSVEKWLPFIELEDYSSTLNNNFVKINISYNINTLGIIGKQLQIELRIT